MLICQRQFRLVPQADVPTPCWGEGPPSNKQRERDGVGRVFLAHICMRPTRKQMVRVGVGGVRLAHLSWWANAKSEDLAESTL